MPFIKYYSKQHIKDGISHSTGYVDNNGKKHILLNYRKDGSLHSTPIKV